MNSVVAAQRLDLGEFGGGVDEFFGQFDQMEVADECSQLRLRRLQLVSTMSSIKLEVST